MRASLFVLSLVVLGCSFTTGANFTECSTDADCGSGFACAHHYCLSLPRNCSRLEGAFDAGNRIPLAVLVPAQVDGGSNERDELRLDAMRLAVWEANTSGGPNNRPYGLFACEVPDEQGSVIGATQWLIQNLEVPAILTFGSSRTRWAADNDFRRDAGTFIMSPNATAALLVSLHANQGNVWRVAPPDTQQAEVLGTLITSADAGRSVSILFEETEYGTGFKEALSAELLRGGLTVPKMVGYHAPLDPAATIAQLDGGSTTTTVVIGFPADVAALAGAAAAVPSLLASAGHRWVLSDAAKDPTILTAVTKPVLEGALGTAPAQASGVAFHNFQQDFESRYGSDPSLYSFTAHSSDAMWLTLAATVWASKSGATITGPAMAPAMANLASGKEERLLGSSWVDLALNLLSHTPVDVEGSSGPLVFDVSAGAPASKYEVWQVKNGAIVSGVDFLPH